MYNAGPKFKYEIYPKIEDRTSNHPAYRLEFHQWESHPETWKLEIRNFIFSNKEWDEMTKSTTDLLMGREGHPYTIMEGTVTEGIPNKQWLMWMVDALNERALLDVQIENIKRLMGHCKLSEENLPDENNI
jgi:hypothetical protein